MTNKEKQRAVRVLLDKYDKKHLSNLLRRKKVIDDLYNSVSREAARIGVACPFDDPDKPFYLDDYPATKARVDDLMENFMQDLEITIAEGSKEEWLLSASKNAAMIDILARGTGIPKETLNRWKEPNLDALKVFQERKENGFNLSKSVWDLGQQTKSQLELAMDVGLGQGKSAAELSRDVRQYLKEPNKLFRRVRDKEGNLRLSKNAQAYHPGQGVYRSSYKNALRMTATENNMAYRTADHEKWNDLDFVIGYEIALSNNHTLNGKPFEDICDDLAGEYPKDFKFTGWHPFCRCIAIPILADFNEVMEHMNDEEYHYKGEITDLPDGFNEWIENNADRLENAKSVPYFVKDNYVDGDPAKGLIKDLGYNEKEQQIKEQENPSAFIMTEDVLGQLDDRGFDRKELHRINDYIDDYNNSAIAGFNVLEFDDTMQSVMEKNKMTITKSSLSLSKNKENVHLKYNFCINEDSKEYNLIREFFYDNREKCVCHSYFELPEERQKLGISKELFKSMFIQYESCGIDKVFVHANIDVGGHCWAKYGFIGEKDEISLIVKNAYYSKIITKDEFNDAMSIIGCYDKEIPMQYLAYKDYSEKMLKREGVSWFGYINLHNEEQMDYLHKYLGIEK